MLRDLDRITERVVKISDDLPFVRKFLNFLGTETDLSKATHVHLITSDTRYLHGWFLEANDPWLKDQPNWEREMDVGPRHDLVDILKKGNPQSFDELLMLVTFFLYAGPRNWDLIPVKSYIGTGSLPDRVLDEILSKTKGYVIFGFQTERLMAIFERDSGVRRDLLREFRLFRPNAVDWLSKQRFDDGQSLLDVITRRTWVRPVSSPPMGFSFRLASLLFSNDQGGHRNN